MKTRIIHTKIWDDEWFTELSEHAQYLFFYIITNHRINLCGIYELPTKIIIRETKIRVRDFLKAKEELYPKVLFYRNFVWVVNAQRHGGYKGEKNNIACERELEFISKEIKKGLYKQKEDRVLIEYRYPSDTSINHKSEIINNKSYSSLEFLNNLPGEVIKEFSEKFNCYEIEIRGKAEDLYNYCLAKGKKYKDYKAFLRNAVKKDFGIRRKEPPKAWEKPENKEKSEEGLKKLKELKEKFQIKKCLTNQ